jgi:hypothetical protein
MDDMTRTPPPPVWLMWLAVRLMPAAHFHHDFPNKIHAFGLDVPGDTVPVGRGGNLKVMLEF